jgi:hypothetical protein
MILKQFGCGNKSFTDKEKGKIPNDFLPCDSLVNKLAPLHKFERSLRRPHTILSHTPGVLHSMGQKRFDELKGQFE